MPDQTTQTPECFCCTHQHAHSAITLQNVFENIDDIELSSVSSEGSVDTDDEKCSESDTKEEDDIFDQDSDVVSRFYLACSDADSKTIRTLAHHRDIGKVHLLYGIKSVLQWCIDTPVALEILFHDLEYLCQVHYPPIKSYDVLLSHVLLYARQYTYTSGLVHRLVLSTHDPLIWIRAALRCDKDLELVESLFKYAVQQSFRLKLSQIVHLTKYGLLKCADNTVGALDTRLALLLSQIDIISQPINYEDISKFMSLIMDEDMHVTLKVVLQYAEVYQVIRGMKRYGTFQDCIERNRCRVIKTLLTHPSIRLFYADIIDNLLQRKSHIIKSKDMEHILAHARHDAA